MKRHIIRSAKYLAWMLVLFTAIFVVMNLTKTSAVQGVDGFVQMMSSKKGPMLVFVLIALAAVYPLAGFMKRTVYGTLPKEDIVDVMKELGFKMSEYKDEYMVFNASSPIKKFAMYFEDRIEIAFDGENMTIDGMRKEVVRIEYRFNKLLISRGGNE
ncbi:MAG: hypothetical protein R3Y15_07720 [Rikenellaceae bacterium]